RAWGSRSCSASSIGTAAGCGRKRSPAKARLFSSRCAAARRRRAPRPSKPSEQRMAESRKARAVGFNHVALEVGDIEEALAFYGRLFTFEMRSKSDVDA